MQNLTLKELKKSLNATQFQTIEDIINRTDSNGISNVSNAHLEELWGVTERATTYRIKSLIIKGLVKVEIIKEKGKKTKRKIHLLFNLVKETFVPKKQDVEIESKAVEQTFEETFDAKPTNKDAVEINLMVSEKGEDKVIEAIKCSSNAQATNKYGYIKMVLNNPKPTVKASKVIRQEAVPEWLNQPREPKQTVILDDDISKFEALKQKYLKF